MNLPGILAIDPGPTESAYVIYNVETGDVPDFGKWDNVRLLELLRTAYRLGDLSTIVIEKVEGFGMAVGAEVFETVYWSGRFAEAAYPVHVDRIGRRAIKLHLCGQARAKDANVRQALIDGYGGPAAIGKKASPGPLYGIAGDVWSALAVAVTWAETRKERAA